MKMEHRTIEVKLICAKDLKNVNVFSKMDVYVIGSVSGDPRSILRSPVARGGGTSPKWNHDMKFTFEESAAMMNRLGLIFQIMSDRTLGDKEIGRVYVPLKELFDASNGGYRSSDGGVRSSGENDVNEGRQMVYQVQTPTAKFKGQLEFSFKFGQKFTQTIEPKLDEPVIAYPAAGPNPGVTFVGATSTPDTAAKPGPTQHDVGGAVTTYGHGARLSQPSPAYMNMPPNYGCGLGDGRGFGYICQQMPRPTPNPNPYMGYSYGYSAGYGYPGQSTTRYAQQLPAQKTKRNKMGLGAAAGIGAGLLGGLLVGDMVENAAETMACDDMLEF